MSPGPSEGSTASPPVPLEALIFILRCPRCQAAADLEVRHDELICPACAAQFPMDRGVPLMLPESREVRVVPPDHESNQIDESVLDWLDSFPGWTLNLGAGSSVRRPPRCIEVEYALFRNTSVVGDAHRLPFKDGAFDAVISYNTFEHLRDPPVAASELHRVLRPGGRLRMQTAFLQPLHEEPAHFYNCTEFGLREWFSAFEIEDCFVPGNMNPAFALGWVSSVLLWNVGVERGVESRRLVSDTSLEYWAAFWDHRFDAHPDESAAAIVQGLSQQAQRQVSFGHELRASAPDVGRVSSPPEAESESQGELIDILRCPNCEFSGGLSRTAAGLECGQCGRIYPVVNDVPVLTRDLHDVSVMPADHESNPISDSVLDWLESLPGWSLNLGAGATKRRPARCVELEYSVFRNTSVVADAHRLPFHDDTFDAVVSYNTFEHLLDPAKAAKELLRVLKPGGKIRLQTAFLQPLHEDPAHFFNATEFGVRNWFSDFVIDDCFVSPEMGPAHMLGWLANHVLYHAEIAEGPRVGAMARTLRLSQFARFWEVPSTRAGFLRVLFELMPDRMSRFSAGFELRAKKAGLP